MGMSAKMEKMMSSINSVISRIFMIFRMVTSEKLLVIFEGAGKK
jgi:hypothetical protein